MATIYKNKDWWYVTVHLNGEYIDNETLLDKPEIKPIKQTVRKFIKVHDKLEDINLKYLQQGYLFYLAKYIEYGTGRLTISKGVGIFDKNNQSKKNLTYIK